MEPPTSHLLLVGMQNGTAALENKYKTKLFIMQDSNCTPWYLSKEGEKFKQGMVVYAYNSNTWKAETRDLFLVQGQTVLHRRFCLKTMNKQKKKTKDFISI